MLFRFSLFYGHRFVILLQKDDGKFAGRSGVNVVIMSYKYLFSPNSFAVLVLSCFLETNEINLENICSCIQTKQNQCL